jgi:ectoine hydroxylase-related dioxygenase (phytanoyl-CoA dioxygenase family)
MVNLERIKTDYDKKGYVKLPSLFSPQEIKEWQAEADRLWSLPEIGDPENIRVDWRANIHGERVPERMDPVTDISPLFSRLSRDQRILSVVKRLLGEEPILFKDKLIIKPPDVDGYPLHQDFAYIDFLGFEGSQQLATCIAIDPTVDAAGPIEFFPDFHHRRLPSPDTRPGELDKSTLDSAEGEVLNMEPGDIVIFSSLCPHRSDSNRSGSPRRLIFFTYNARSTGDLYATYYRLGKP